MRTFLVEVELRVSRHCINDDDTQRSEIACKEFFYVGKILEKMSAQQIKSRDKPKSSSNEFKWDKRIFASNRREHHPQQIQANDVGERMFEYSSVDAFSRNDFENHQE